MMRHYCGTKMIDGEPMNRLDFNAEQSKIAENKFKSLIVIDKDGKPIVSDECERIGCLWDAFEIAVECINHCTTCGEYEEDTVINIFKELGNSN